MTPPNTLEHAAAQVVQAHANGGQPDAGMLDQLNEALRAHREAEEALPQKLDRIEALVCQALRVRKPQPWMTKAAAARELGVTTRTFGRKYVETGIVREVTRLGRSMVRRVDVMAAKEM